MNLPLHHERLRGLRSQRASSTWSLFSPFAGREKWGFLLVTLALLLSFTTLTLFSRVAQTYGRFREREAVIFQTLTDFLVVAPNLETEVHATLEEEIYGVMAPLDSFLLTRPLTSNYLNRGLELVGTWKQALEPFKAYEISARGLTGGLNAPTFTSTLEDFLLRLPDLLARTRGYLRSFWFVRALGLASSNLQSSFFTLDRLLRLGDLFVESTQALLTFFGHYTTQRLVLFNQNPGEARPTGGFTGSYLSLDLSQGQLEILESQSIYHVSNLRPNPLVAHPITWQYAGSSPHGLHNLNYFSCFRDSAALLAGEFERSVNGFTIDQLYFITPPLLTALLPPDFVLEVPGVGLLNERTLFEEIERVSSFAAVDIENPKKQLASIFTALVAAFPELVKTRPALELVRILLTKISTRDLQYWFEAPALQEFFASLGIHSNVACLDLYPHTISFVLNNLAVDKRHLITRGHFSISARPLLSGVRIRLRYAHTLEAVESLQRGFNYEGRSFLGFVLPNAARNLEVITVAPALHLAARRPYYYANAGRAKTLYTPPVIERVAQSALDVPSGVLYQHPDGSLLLGAYVRDDPDRVSELTVEFDLPRSALDELRFYPQPALNDPTLTFGRGAALRTDPTVRRVAGDYLDAGVDLKIN